MEKFKLKSLIQNTLILLLVLFSSAQAADKITFYHYDLLGSPVATTNEKGEVTWREEYSPYGEKLLKQDAGQDNVRGYTGHVFDEETGLTYMQARYYDPQIGRFMGVDPVGFDPKNPSSFNRYAYGNNNPYKYTDPNGETPDPTDAFDVGKDLGGVCVGVGGVAYGLATDDDSYKEAGFEAISDSITGLGITFALMVNPLDFPGAQYLDDVYSYAKKFSPKKSNIDLPSLDSTGKVHGVLPDPKDLKNHSSEELAQLKTELEKSVQQRINKNVELGSDKAHGQRQAAEQQLIKSIEKYLSN